MYHLIILATILFVLANSEYRTNDGWGNNIQNPQWGAAGQVFLRGDGVNSWKARYQDGVGEPIKGKSSRFISNMIPGSGKPFADPNPISALHAFWGQFLDHDITLRPPVNQSEMLLIEVPEDDPIFVEPYGCFGNCTMPFGRSQHQMINGVREQANVLSSYVDGSVVYGINPIVIPALREPDSCLMRVSKTNVGDMLPKNTDELPMANEARRVPLNTLFLAGEQRANNNPGLTALHTLFVREHNRLCGELGEKHPEWDQEKLFQEARKWNIAYMQRITFSEYVATTIGGALPDWNGYKENVNPGIDTMFSTALFRYGHSEILEEVPRRGENYEAYSGGDLELRDCFFNTACWEADGIDPILRGMIAVRQNKVDIFYVEALRNFLFGTGPNGFVTVDLFARNIERGRDHGLISYNDAREFFGLPRKNSFEEISTNQKHVDALRNAYDTVDDIEAYSGSLAEDYLPGAFVGELIAVSITEQYLRIRDGDRFYYENQEVSGFTDDEVRIIQSTRFADILTRNTGIRKAFCSAMFVPQNFERLDCGPDAYVPEVNGNHTGIFDTYGLSWTVNLDSQTISITMRGRTAGWVGFGIPDPVGLGGMIGGDAYIGWVETNGQVTLSNYDLLSRTPACVNGHGVCINQAGTNILTEVSGTEVDGWTIIQFTRPLITAHNFDIVEGLNRVIYAFGPTKQLSRHGLNLGRPQLTFFTQSATSSSTSEPTTSSTSEPSTSSTSEPSTSSTSEPSTSSTSEPSTSSTSQPTTSSTSEPTSSTSEPSTSSTTSQSTTTSEVTEQETVHIHTQPEVTDGTKCGHTFCRSQLILLILFIAGVLSIGVYTKATGFC
jgi:hypothetical protein